jgi:hypothetical protein
LAANILHMFSLPRHAVKLVIVEDCISVEITSSVIKQNWISSVRVHRLLANACTTSSRSDKSSNASNDPIVNDLERVLTRLMRGSSSSTARRCLREFVAEETEDVAYDIDGEGDRPETLRDHIITNRNQHSSYI